MMLYSVRMISANMVSVIVKFLLFKEGYLVEMPTLLMFLMFTVVFSNGVVKLSEISVGDRDGSPYLFRCGVNYLYLCRNDLRSE